ncbi:MAG: OB-fold domain-containing protein [Deltaproteobacteria bacterium]|nr:OB-fold domain-containing protein [Deltaproteobacteria bacterium]
MGTKPIAGGESIRVPFLMKMEFEYAVGEYATRFFQELKDHGRLTGVRCPECRRVYIPPRPVCGICFEPMTEWVTLSDEGVLVGATVIRLPFVDPMTGKQRPVPYGMGIIRLDGAATGIFHFVDETDETKVRVGRRVKANIRTERQGNLQDIINFRLVDEPHE